MTFEQAIEVILKHEGGYVNDPDDRGGETKYGITKRSYPKLDISSITKDMAIEIYRRDFWKRNDIDSYPDIIKLMMFDMCVNMGNIGAVKVLQRALNRLGYNFLGTGLLGPKTINAAHAAAGTANSAKESGLCYWITIERLNYYNSIVASRSSQSKFLRGWTSRAIDILERSI